MYTNLVFEPIPTILLELRTGIETHKFGQREQAENKNENNRHTFYQPFDDDSNRIEDGACARVESGLVRKVAGLDQDR